MWKEWTISPRLRLQDLRRSRFCSVKVFYRSWVGDARANIQHMHLLRSPVVHVVTYLRTGTNKTHISNEHIDELRQFIELELANRIFLGVSHGASTTSEKDACWAQADVLILSILKSSGMETRGFGPSPHIISSSSV